MKPKVGSEFPVWWQTSRREGDWYMATVLAVLPYTGRYDFDCVLRLLAPRTRRGWLELAYKSK